MHNSTPMNQIFLTDREASENLFPFTLIRSAAEIRVGILTIREKWEAYLGTSVSLVSNLEPIPEGTALLSTSIIPSKEFISSLFQNGKLSDNPDWNAVKLIKYPWHIFQWNDWAIRQDFSLVTQGRRSAAIPGSVQTS